MGIRFLCPTCGKRINVKEQQAGLRGFCPKCGAGVDIPLESTLPAKGEQTDQEASTMAVAKTARANATLAAQPVVDPLHEIPTALWYALPPGAPKPYGPIDAGGLAQWFYESRLTPDSMVWREDWPEWRSVSSVWPKWSPGGGGPGGEPMIDPPADKSSYKLKAVKAQSVAQPPVVATKPGGTASRGAEGAVSSALSAAKAAEASAPAIGSAVAGGGVYYRRRKNGAYLTTVAILMLVVLALGGVMIWVIVREPAPKPKSGDNSKPQGTSPSSTGSKLPPLENPTFTSPTGSPLLQKPTPSATAPKPTATPAATAAPVATPTASTTGS